MSEHKNKKASETTQGETAPVETHITFEIIKGKDKKFYFAVPKDASLGETYDAAFGVLEHVIETIEATSCPMKKPKQEPQESKDGS